MVHFAALHQLFHPVLCSRAAVSGSEHLSIIMTCVTVSVSRRVKLGFYLVVARYSRVVVARMIDYGLE